MTALPLVTVTPAPLSRLGAKTLLCHGAGSGRHPSRMKALPPPVNLSAPTLTREGYFTLPPLKRLQRMTDDELAAVDRFVVSGILAQHTVDCLVCSTMQSLHAASKS